MLKALMSGKHVTSAFHQSTRQDMHCEVIRFKGGVQVLLDMTGIHVIMYLS